MARKKRIILILIILSTLLLAGPGVVDIANAEPISSSIPTDIERQSVPSTLSPSDSIDDGPAQESVKWNLGWNSFDGNWFYVDSVNPVSLHSGWLYTNGAWYWLDPSTHAMAIGLHECNGSAYWFNGSGAMATGWVLDGGTWYYATGVRRAGLRLAQPKRCVVLARSLDARHGDGLSRVQRLPVLV